VKDIKVVYDKNKKEENIKNNIIIDEK